MHVDPSGPSVRAFPETVPGSIVLVSGASVELMAVLLRAVGIGGVKRSS
jgi:hypothetical protein